MSGYMESLFHGGIPANRVYVGVLRKETQPGLYHFEGIGTDGPICVDDAHLLCPDSGMDGGGSHARPKDPSTAVAVSGRGGAIFIVGFNRPATWSEQSDDAPTVGVVEDNNAPGDKSFSTKHGARLLLKEGGAVVIEAGPGTSITLNPINNQCSMLSANMASAADGYLSSHGRVTPGSTDPETTHIEDMYDQVGTSYSRVRLRHGTISDSTRRELTVADVTEIGTNRTGVLKTRETYDKDGSWVGEGPKYQWGAGAAEPQVLGNQLVELFKDLFSTLKTLTVNTAWGPSGPPMPTFTVKLDQLEQQLSGKILSTYLFLSKSPTTLGSTTD